MKAVAWCSWIATVHELASWVVSFPLLVAHALAHGVPVQYIALITIICCYLALIGYHHGSIARISKYWALCTYINTQNDSILAARVTWPPSQTNNYGEELQRLTALGKARQEVW